MTQEDKELLLKDLCARLPYGITLVSKYGNYHTININTPSLLVRVEKDDLKPYLRSMSNMTEEEWQEYQTLKMTDWVEGDINGVFINAGTITDWLNRHHFDYRGLIERGLAIKAPEGMYGKEAEK